MVNLVEQVITGKYRPPSNLVKQIELARKGLNRSLHDLATGAALERSPKAQQMAELGVTFGIPVGLVAGAAGVGRSAAAGTLLPGLKATGQAAMKILKHPRVKAMKVAALRGELVLLAADLSIKGVEKLTGEDLIDTFELGGLLREAFIALPFGGKVIAVAVVGTVVVLAILAGGGLPLLGIGVAIAFGEARQQDLELFGLD